MASGSRQPPQGERQMSARERELGELPSPNLSSFNRKVERGHFVFAALRLRSGYPPSGQLSSPPLDRPSRGRMTNRFPEYAFPVSFRRCCVAPVDKPTIPFRFQKKLALILFSRQNFGTI
jgi:hypothetical protein